MSMKIKSIRTSLVIYYGILQSFHLVALMWAGVHYYSTGRIGFPAPAVSEWSPDAARFLIGTAAMDILFIPFAWGFVWTMLKHHPLERNMEIIALSGSLYSAGLFLIGTLPSGAWQVHPVSYGILVILFAPVVLLTMIDVQLFSNERK